MSATTDQLAPTGQGAPEPRLAASRLTGRSGVIGTSFLLVLLALALGATLSTATADRSYRNDVLAPYVLPMRHLYDKLQSAAKNGVTLERSRGAHRQIDRAQGTLAATANQIHRGAVEPSIVLISADGRIAHSAGPELSIVRQAIIEAVTLPNHDGGPASGQHILEDEDRALIAWRIVDNEGRWTSSIIASVDSRPVEEKRSALREQAIANCVFTLACLLLLFTLLLSVLHEAAIDSKDRSRHLKRVLGLSAGFALVAQLGAIDVSLKPYRDAYPETVAGKTRTLAEIARDDLAPAFRRGTELQYMDFRPFGWEQLMRLLPEAHHMSVKDAEGREVVRVTSTEVKHLLNQRLRDKRADRGLTQLDGTPLVSTWPLTGAQGAEVEVVITEEKIAGRMLDVAGDSFTATMVSLLVFLEMLLVYHVILGLRRPANQVHFASDNGSPAGALMRPAAFIFVFGIDLSMSFVPLHTERLMGNGGGLNAEFVMGLPISAEFLLAGIAILAAGRWVDRRGWRPAFVSGVGLASLGSLYSWLAPDVMHFVISRAVVGAGFGLVLMSTQAFVVARSSEANNARSLAQLFAGIYGGTICGGVAGAVLAEQVGFAPVFALGGLVTVSVLAYVTLVLFRLPDPAPRKEQAEGVATEPGRRALRDFLTSRGVLSLVILSSLPASIAAVGFLNYFAPIHLNRMGASQSTIGQVLMVYGVCLVFIGPLVSRTMSTVQRKKQAVVAGSLLGGVAFLAFDLFDGVWAVVAAVAVLGIAHSFVLSSQSAYLLAMRAARELGQGLSMSLFRSSSRLGQVAGPAIFAAVALAATPSDGLALLGYVYVACAIAFWLLVHRDRSLVAQES